MTDIHDELTKVRQQIDRTLGSLDSVMRAEPDQLRSSFDRYSKDVSALQSDAEKTKKRVRQMKEKKDDYVAAWEKETGQVRNEELREMSDQRTSRVRESLFRMVESLDVAAREFDPFLSNLVDVKKVLGNDLTPTGQALVSSSAVAQNANEHGARVAQSIDAALRATADMASRLSSTGAKN